MDERNIRGEAFNVGDLDGDGADEILVQPDWWQSNWSAYKVYSLNKKENKWYYLIQPVSIFANDLDKKPIIKKSKRKGYLSAYTTESDEEGNIRSSYKDFKIVKP
jgi:hypothetical protein